MTMSEWAENEVRIACKKENPDWDGKSFDYGCSCYESALKAYKCLMSDGHSGYSFSVTRNILDRLMRSMPLTPITDDDFKTGNASLYPDDYLKEHNMVSDQQCPRMSSLFRTEYTDGTVKYHDNNRAYCVNIENTFDTFSCRHAKIIDEMFPITMPYMPNPAEKYKIYMQQFLSNRCDIADPVGSFDCEAVLHVECPDGTIMPINRYYSEEEDENGKGKMVEITEEEYNKLLATRRYTSADYMVCHILEDMYGTYSTVCNGKHIDREDLSDEDKQSIDDAITEKCQCFNNKLGLNLFNISQSLFSQSGETYHKVIMADTELMELVACINSLYDKYGKCAECRCGHCDGCCCK